jgi:transposase-like protein
MIGRKRGIDEYQKENIIRMIKLGYDVRSIAQSLKVTMKKVKELQKEIKEVVSNE